jgi:hypothetical protein
MEDWSGTEVYYLTSIEQYYEPIVLEEFEPFIFPKSIGKTSTGFKRRLIRPPRNSFYTIHIMNVKSAAKSELLRFFN